jgi:7,8-dihydropterin-6-yl-methyl-4-(beta-D-ribofuranosyl)aminobenzene 5'-phosphate synthase
MCDDRAGAGHHHHTTPAVLPERDWNGEQIPLEPVDSVSVLTICDNVSDALLLDQGPAHRMGGLGGSAAGEPPLVDAPTLESGKAIDALQAQHGFSALVTVEQAGRTHRLLFDTGLTPDGCVDNLRRLGIDPGTIEAIVCSHGHFDHTTGLSGLVSTLGRTETPVLIHPDFWLRRRLAIPGRDPFELPTTSRRGLEDAGFRIIEQRQPSFLLDGSVLVTGEVDRTTAFEKGFAVHQAERDGAWTPDPLILDDQALIVHVRGRGLVVLTGCGHAGIVNIVRYARRLTGVDAVHAVLGGFHLSGPLFEPIIGETVDALAALAPDVVVPAHCTGWRAVHAFAARMPEAFIQNSVGTRYDFVAA